MEIIIRNKNNRYKRKRGQAMSEIETMLMWDKYENTYKSVIDIKIIKSKIEECKKIIEKLNKTNDVEKIKAINERLIAYQELLLTEE